MKKSVNTIYCMNDMIFKKGQLTKWVVLENGMTWQNELILKKKKNLAKWVDNAKDHPDVDHLSIGGGRQGAR